jgi:hypothetical protein
VRSVPGSLRPVAGAPLGVTVEADDRVIEIR